MHEFDPITATVGQEGTLWTDWQSVTGPKETKETNKSCQWDGNIGIWE